MSVLPQAPQFHTIGVRDGSSLERRETVFPGMCGSTALFAARVGDWTWETVGTLCEVDVLNAADEAGRPAYLSFFYFRIRSGKGLHPGSLEFGDRLRVASRLFGLGSQSVLTLHRIERAGADTAAAGAAEPDGFHWAADESAIRVEIINRWISRTRPDSNQALMRASPVGFEHRHLPRVPEQYSPRAECHRARRQHTFRDGALLGFRPTGELDLSYPVDVTRDLNRVGLLYFAAYFGIVDQALHRFLRGLGLTDAAFLDRVILDQRICYLGNADAGAVLDVRVTRFEHPRDPAEQVYDVVIRDAGRLLAVSTVQLRI